MKHLVDLDDALLQDAMRCLRTKTIKATVDQALKAATASRRAELERAFERFGELAAELPIVDRSEAW